MLDFSDIIFGEFATPATFNGMDLESGAVVRARAEMGVPHGSDTPSEQRMVMSDMAKVTIRKVDLPDGTIPRYRDVVATATKDWHIQNQVTETGATWECWAVGQFRTPTRRA